MIIAHKTTRLTCKPARAAALQIALAAADKIQSPRQFRARANAGGVSRKYPKFSDGMSTDQYVRQYAVINGRSTGYGIQRGAYQAITDIKRENDWVDAFYAPLSTAPQFASAYPVLEEDLV